MGPEKDFIFRYRPIVRIDNRNGERKDSPFARRLNNRLQQKGNHSAPPLRGISLSSPCATQYISADGRTQVYKSKEKYARSCIGVFRRPTPVGPLPGCPLDHGAFVIG